VFFYVVFFWKTFRKKNICFCVLAFGDKKQQGGWGLAKTEQKSIGPGAGKKNFSMWVKRLAIGGGPTNRTSPINFETTKNK